jgi:hypothetical protein
MSANAVSASRPKIWGSQNEAKPASAAFRAASIVALSGPLAVSPPKIPIRIVFPDPSLRRGYDTAESAAEGQLGASSTFYADHGLTWRRRKATVDPVGLEHGGERAMVRRGWRCGVARAGVNAGPAGAIGLTDHRRGRE